MKKIITQTLLILSLFGLIGFSFINVSYAATGHITVIVTEKIPGADCVPETTGNISSAGPIQDTATGNYKCKVEKGFGSVVKMLGSMIKYLTFIAGLGGVLYLVVNGILYSMGGMGDDLKTKAKEAISKVLIGLVILFLSGVILNIIAPWIYK